MDGLGGPSGIRLKDTGNLFEDKEERQPLVRKV